MEQQEKRPLKQGRFNRDDMTVTFGGEHTKPEFCFIAKAIHCPVYEYKVKERESLGGGWYGSVETVTKVADRNYLVVKDGLCIGVLYDPYVIHGIKSFLHPLDEKTPKPIMDFFKSLNIPYKHYISNKEPLTP